MGARQFEKSRRGQAGFTVIEVIVAILLVAMVAVAAATTLAGAGKAQGTAKVRDRQAAAAQSILERVRGDSSWSRIATCKNSYMSPTGSCNLTTVIASLNADKSLQYGTTSFDKFRITATAKGIDLPGDNVGGVDQDGVLPDIYRVTIAIDQPNNGTGTGNYSAVQPLTVTSDINFSDAATKGTATVVGCFVTAQIDERSPIAGCPTGSTVMNIDAPNGFDPNAPGSCNTRDCIAWRCANPAFRGGYCPSQFLGYGGANANYIRETISSLSHQSTGYTITGIDSNTSGVVRTGTLSWANGSNTELNLIPGQYQVNVSAPAGFLPWKSHSLPSKGFLSVTAGSESRYVAMFKPGVAPDLTIRLHTTDSTLPWAPVPVNGTKKPICVMLVPAPIGRTLMASPQSAPYTTAAACVNAGAQNVVIRRPEPGLYLHELTNSTFTSWYEIDHTPGFLFVPGAIPADPVVELGFCDPQGRDALRAMYGNSRDITTTNPITGVSTTVTYPLPDCHSSSGGPGPPGGGGGGGS